MSRTPRKKSRGKKFLLVLCGLGFGLLLTEVYLRVAGYSAPLFYQPDYYRGVVLRPRGGQVRREAEDRVRADAAVTINGLVRWTITHGCAGLEAWAGTPGTVGGAVFGNAHFGGRLIGDLIVEARVAARDGSTRDVPAGAMAFGYDRSRLQTTGEVLLSAAFRVSSGDPAALRAAARQSLAFRKHVANNQCKVRMRLRKFLQPGFEFVRMQIKRAIQIGHDALPFVRVLGKWHTSASASRRRCVVDHQAVEQDAGLLPIALHGAFGHRPHLSNLGEGESAEKFEVDAFGEMRIQFSQFLERVDEFIHLAIAVRHLQFRG